MTRVYLGVDIVEIDKFGEILTRHEDFLTDVFTPKEREYCQARRDPQVHLAGHFAAKESYLKALGTGLSGIGVAPALGEIEITHQRSGRPRIAVSGWVARLTERRGIRQSTVSISHAAHYAIAAVVLVGE
jgi:holo-[acyl-carrier protein] synthase